MNAAIRKYCEDYAKGYFPDRPVEPDASSSFSMWVRDMRLQGDLMSIQFMEQSFYSGAAHFTHGNPCLNIDMVTHRRVYFPELFSFSKTASKAQFCDRVNAESDEVLSELQPQDLKKERAFFMDRDSLILCFDDYDRGPSMTQMKVSYASLAPFWSARSAQYLGIKAK